ncbi:MAG TPA: 2-phosphosulfolactate phosphatase [Methylomirabilota bacterium]|nr:2-phosphosulfolactate phosphatase [Methylomirabilota bacterium]
MQIEVALSPAEFPAIAARDLRATTCVVFDVLRATSSMLTALNNGAEAIIPVSEISEALAIRQKQPSVLLAGERNGLRIGRELTGGIDFDLGNSPRDFGAEKIRGKTIAWTTTNGTRALRACAHAEMVLLGALANLRVLADILDQLRPQNLLLICAGTFEAAAFEDLFAAGALIDSLQHLTAKEHCSDAAQLVWHAYRHVFDDAALIASSLNARRLLANPDLAPDVAICLQRDTVQFNASLLRDGTVRAMPGFGAKLA